MLRASVDRRRSALILTGLAVGVMCGTLSLAQTVQPGSIQRESLIATGDTPDLFLLYTGDVIGYLDPCG